jgi:hypothetical protein
VEEIIKYKNKDGVATALTTFNSTYFLVSASSNFIVKATVKLKAGPL